ncbi:MAG: glucosamine-6-phosphate deaminase [Rubripirellula sp.]
MQTILTADRNAMGRLVADRAAEDLRNAIQQHGHANLIVATGASQFEVLENLVKAEDLDWSLVNGFHLDEYVGISAEHPASFCRYLKERFVDRVPLADFQYLFGDQDPAETIRQVSQLISESRIDVALVGIGENGHLAFNDPPADFETTDPYLLVELDRPCRMQQVGEGWFAQLDDVPTHAISMSVKQILKSAKIYCSVPDSQKAVAVAATIEGPISPDVPASILKSHDQTLLIIDQASAAKLSSETLETLEPSA